MTNTRITSVPPGAFALGDRFEASEGKVALGGVQALVRVLLDQARLDRALARHIGTLVTGYRGSPLGGFDRQLQSNADLLERHDIHFLEGLNEDLAATTVMGSQIARFYPEPRFDGTRGMWFGKAPGVDRSGDAFRHANITGVDPLGGVLVAAGDDPGSKSSSLPSATEFAFLDLQMPVFQPGSVQEIVEFGNWAFELSRFSGLWTAMKIVTNVADAYATIELSGAPVDVTRPRLDGGTDRPGGIGPWHPTLDHRHYPPHNLEQEREIVEQRIVAAHRFAAANGLYDTPVSSGSDRFGIVASGKPYYDLREALRRLGVDDDRLRQHGIRLFRPKLIFPLDRDEAVRFASGLREVLIVEEKRPFLEMQLRDLLYGRRDAPLVLGKKAVDGTPLFPAYGELDTELIAKHLRTELERWAPELKTERLPSRRRIKLPLLPSGPEPNPQAHELRSPYFCSGCPHNRSTVVPEGSIAGAGIGCHAMALLMDRTTYTSTHMGAEGMQWVGAAPFSATDHVFQNIGDGTFFHSGSLAIRQAVSARTNITYKILWNDAVAMTGGQDVLGARQVPDLVDLLRAEGVARVAIVTEGPRRYRALRRRGVVVAGRDALDDVQRSLRDIPGVTVLIYEQACAAELRRRRRRGLAVDPAQRVVINTRVCEGCGDCGTKSNCLSVHPVETELGRKTTIHQASCNKDYSCLDGDCPAFVVVTPSEPAPGRGRTAAATSSPAPLPSPLPPVEPRVGPTANIVMTGIGGTGVVTCNQVLATAALLDGKTASALDQTGLSQKGGPVVSSLKISPRTIDAASKVGEGDADVLLVFDVLAAADDKNLSRADPQRTLAVVSTSRVPTGLMVSDVRSPTPDFDQLEARIAANLDAAPFTLDAERVALDRFGTNLPANMVVVGAAFQLGLIPLTEDSIRRAIDLNGVAADMNQNAFVEGRSLVVDEVARDERMIEPAPVPATISALGLSSETTTHIAFLHRELCAYQGPRLADRFSKLLSETREAELLMSNGSELTEAVADGYFKLLAYKDEYEVARLLLADDFSAGLRRDYGAATRVSYRLHPPVLRKLGLRRKIALGSWFRPALIVLRSLRRLRGTPFDPFGYAHERRRERKLVSDYETLLRNLLPKVDASNMPTIVELAALPEMIRGYDSVKAANIERYESSKHDLLVSLRRSLSE